MDFVAIDFEKIRRKSVSGSVMSKFLLGCKPMDFNGIQKASIDYIGLMVVSTITTRLKGSFESFYPACTEGETKPSIFKRNFDWSGGRIRQDATIQSGEIPFRMLEER
ncbi:hypothetical protein Q1695_001606 [Nippostrongylus brasiliensis]|nr:hypothetical protein Q1695_001606 [Nippostrongylus brasiliensis]